MQNNSSDKVDRWYDPKFLENGSKLLKFLQDYHNNIRDLSVKPNFDQLKPLYMRSIISDKANEEARSLESLMDDLRQNILPGMVHWQSPKFHGFYPIGYSHPSLYANLLSDGFGCVAFHWSSCPAFTELEMIMVDWIAQEMNLPSKFKFNQNTKGGGIIQGTASEALLVVFIAAREKKIRELMELNPTMTYYKAMSRIMAYTSQEAHFAIPKAACLSAVQLVCIKACPHDLSVDTKDLEETIQRDIANGKHPFLVIATMGTTNTCAFDDLQTIGIICQRYNIWFHIDAAYAGSMLFCEEYQKIYGGGFEKAHSITFNPHKIMGVCFDCAILWVESAINLDHSSKYKAAYLKPAFENANHYLDWEIPLGRRFRALKLYFHIGLIGMKGIRQQIKKIIHLAKYMESLIKLDSRFSISYPVECGLVCLYYKKSNDLTNSLYKEINKQDIYLTSTFVNDQILIRFSVGCPKTNESDMLYAWDIIRESANKIDQLI